MGEEFANFREVMRRVRSLPDAVRLCWFDALVEALAAVREDQLEAACDASPEVAAALVKIRDHLRGDSRIQDLPVGVA